MVDHNVGFAETWQEVKYPLSWNGKSCNPVHLPMFSPSPWQDLFFIV